MPWELLRTVFLSPLLGGSTAHLIYRWFEPRELYLHFILLVLAPLALTPLLMTYFSRVLLAALSAWVCYLASLLACTILYRISPVHPLYKYPGPLLCKVTKLYFSGVVFGGKQHKYYNELHQRYGDIVRIGPNELSFSSPDFIAPVYGANGMPKSASWDFQVNDPDYRIMIGIRNPQEHANVRRIWARGFTPDALRGYLPILNARIEQLLDHLEAQSGETVDLSKWMTWFTNEVLNDIAFGDDLDIMRNKDSRVHIEMLEEALPYGAVLGHLPWMVPFFKGIPATGKKVKDQMKLCYARMEKRLKEGSPCGVQDMIHHVTGDGPLDSTLGITQIVVDAPLIMAAGSDTSSFTLCTLFHFLLRNPVVYSRLQAELDHSNLSYDDALGLAHLEYLNAAINEALRIIPPVPSGSPRAPLIGSGGIMLGPHFLPEGTTASIHTYTLHRDPRNFFLPNEFIPERWLSEEKQLALEPDLFKNRDLVVHNTNAFIPFSYGPADCIGKRFAWNELRAVTAAILQRFTLQFDLGCDKASWERDICDYFITTRPPLYVVFMPRLASECRSSSN